MTLEKSSVEPISIALVSIAIYALESIVSVAQFLLIDAIVLDCAFANCR